MPKEFRELHISSGKEDLSCTFDCYISQVIQERQHIDVVYMSNWIIKH